jgi:acetyltransferase-like isoleucine patch superfamily enzyme
MSLVTWLDRLQYRVDRKLELWRGQLLRLRGAKVGRRFGVGRGTRLLYARCFSAADDVTLADYSYLHCLSTRGVQIGCHTSIDRNLWLHCGGRTGQGFVEIGEQSYIGCNAVIGAGGGVTIGNHVLIGQSVNFHAENHRFDQRDQHIMDQGVIYQSIVIEDDVWIGSQVTVLAGVTIGQGAVIGAGAVVTRSIPGYAIAIGVPAYVTGYRGNGS